MKGWTRFVSFLLTMALLCGFFALPGMAEVGTDPQIINISISLIDAGEKKEVTSAVMTLPSGATNEFIIGKKTDQEGVLVLKAPVGTVITSITAGGVTYTGNAAVTVNGTQDFIFYPVNLPDPFPYNVTGTAGGYSNGYEGLTISAPGDYTVSSNGTATVPITVTAAGAVNLTLNGVRTVIPDATDSPALCVTGSAKLVLRAKAKSELTGGAGRAGILGANADVEIEGGVLVSDIEAKNVVVSGGSIFGNMTGNTQSVPVEITLAGANDNTQIAAADIAQDAAPYAYGLDGVHTVGNKLRFYLPAGAALQSVTAGGLTYTGDAEYAVPQIGGSVVLYPPQFDALAAASGTEKEVFNDYKNGLNFEDGGDLYVKMGRSVETAKAPVTVIADVSTSVHIQGVKIETEERGVPALRYDVLSDKPADLIFSGANELSSYAFTFPETGAFNLGLKFEQGATVKVGGIDVAPLSYAASSKVAKAQNITFLRALEDLEFKTGAAGGSFTFVKSKDAENVATMTNLDMAYEGVLPMLGTLVIDKNSTLTVGEKGALIVFPATKVVGEGAIDVRGKLVGKVDTNVRFAVDVRAAGGRSLTVTGVTGGFADRGDTVSAAVTDETDFIGWEISPAVAGLDLSKTSVAFTVDQAYSVKALYKTPVKGAAFTKKQVEVETGDSRKLSWNFQPADATDKAVTLVSDHPEIAEVDDTGVVYGASSGTAIITLKTVDGGFTDTCEVTVADGAVRPLDVETAAIKKGAVLKLKAPSGYEGVWSVKNEAVAKIVKGNKLKGLETGETELTFTVQALTSKRPSLVKGKALAVGETASVPLAVRLKKELVASLGFGAKKLYLAPDEEMPLSPTIKPQTARDTAIYYQTSDARVVRVEDGKLVAMGKGKATVTGTASSFVKKKLTIVVTDVLQSLTAAQKKATLPVGGFYQCEVVPNPLGLADVPVTWTSKNESVATVDKDGLVQGVKKGKTKIIAQSGNKKAAITVTVK